ncbi:MAG: trigger factor [Alphaproteobacteria bacterium]|nr:trigger factor [Alphaproteobacteria bacterium]MBN9557414.1 trigger factor [Alphaproteobacteria bacterium]MBN9568467.1 trigger factor [Alphaproteobacteria bacterium]MBN9579354.1 trigger factor [Alphaproteobacteria bacterium]OJU56400.1 MAG: trigger factor [Alphaproteobacteria bacterium 62-8]
MNITETVNENLHREFKIVIGAGDLDQRLTGKLTEMAPRVHLKGFRPGKAPVSFLKKTYGKSMMGEIVEEVVSESSQKAIKDNELKPALPPKVDLVSEIQKVVDGEADLEFTVKVDLMPDFELTDVAKLKVERLVGEAGDADVDEALKRLAEQARTYSTRDGAAEKDDAVVIDFVGSIDGEEFEGGKAEDFNLTLGSGQLIPGFEDQLIGKSAGEDVTVQVKFPEDYGSAKLAGKDASFAVKVKEVKKPDELAIDDELAKRFGVDTLGALKERVRDQLKQDYSRASRMHLKRRVLDALDGAHSFDLPPTMVEGEFDAIWNQVQQELKQEGKTFEDEGKSEDELKQEYRAIAERRVRLGLVLARIGEQNGLTVAPDELQRAIAARARQFPGQEQQVFNFYANNAQAMNEIRAPIFEDKVVDFIAELAEVNDRTVDRETLFMDPDEAREKLDGAGGAEPAKKEKKPRKSAE